MVKSTKYLRNVGIGTLYLILLLLPNLLFSQTEVGSSRTRQNFTLSLQTRDASGSLKANHIKADGSRTAVIVVDMWDQHWCKSFTSKTAALIPKMNHMLKAARALGLQIVFAPSDVTSFYGDYPQRKAAIQKDLPAVEIVQTFDPPLPPWSQTGGCECSKERPCITRKIWRRQHAGLIIEPTDLISENEREMVSIFHKKGIDRLIYVGVASNMCISVTRPFSAIPMTRYGFDCVVVRDLTEAISGNEFDPDNRRPAPEFTPQKASAGVIAHIEQYIAPTIAADQLVIQAGMQPWKEPNAVSGSAYDPKIVATYQSKGPTVSFRQLCYDYNWVGRTLDDIPKKFSRADPAELAELSRKANMDAALILAVPHHGYTTYNTKYGEKFPALKDDWFGEVVNELHKRNIHAFGYITLGVHWKFMRDHAGTPYVHVMPDEDGTISHEGLCINAPGYLELLENYSKELLTNYPLDALRYDMLYSAKRCECEGCHKLYKTLYGQELTSWKEIDAKDPSKFDYFYLATLRNAAERLTKVCRSVKPGIEIWQNHINTYSEADLNSGRQYDVAYIEFGHPVKLLALRGILDKEAIIAGQTLTSPIRRLIMALGGRCYQYIKVNQETALPDDRNWMLNDLAPFFEMVSHVQPYLEHATLPSTVGLVFSENTRYHFPGFNREPYMQSCESVTAEYLSRSLPIRYINALDLHEKDLSGYKVLLLPRTSGITVDQLQVLKNYVNNGGTLIALGDALLYDDKGKALSNFALAEEMGIQLRSLNVLRGTRNVTSSNLSFGFTKTQKTNFLRTLGDSVKLDNFIDFAGIKGKTSVWVNANGAKKPLVHHTDFGKGRFVYIATPDDASLTRAVAEHYTGKIPLQVSEPSKQVVLAEQEKQNRYILHLIDDGDFEVRLKKDFATFNKITRQYPQTGWSASMKETKTEIIIAVKGDAKDRLLVLGK